MINKGDFFFISCKPYEQFCQSISSTNGRETAANCKLFDYFQEEISIWDPNHLQIIEWKGIFHDINVLFVSNKFYNCDDNLFVSNKSYNCDDYQLSIIYLSIYYSY